MVDSLTEEFRILVSRYLGRICPPESVVSGSESDATSISDADEEDDDRTRKRKGPVPDPKKRGGLMKLAQAFSSHRSSKSTTPAAPAVSSGTGSGTAATANKVKLKAEDVWDTPDSSEAEVKNRKSSPNKSKVRHMAILLDSRNCLLYYTYISCRRKLETRKNQEIGNLQ
jgi:hypothetical protein